MWSARLCGFSVQWWEATGVIWKTVLYKIDTRSGTIKNKRQIKIGGNGYVQRGADGTLEKLKEVS